MKFNSSNILRKKTRWELIRLSAAVMGIEIAYAAETAFVSPIFLQIGISHQMMTMLWGLSPIIGFFLTPVLGSLSDQCTLSIGRRRPFIILTAIGVVLGLILVPNGQNIGIFFGDYDNCALNSTLAVENKTVTPSITTTEQYSLSNCSSKYWTILLTLFGTILLDFNADSGQAPARTYLCDVTIKSDHARGLSTFTLMAGVGGCLGYILGAIDWNRTFIGPMFGGQIPAVFTIVSIIFVVCILLTITSFAEIPLKKMSKKTVKLGSDKIPMDVLVKKKDDNCSSNKKCEYILECLPAEKGKITSDHILNLEMNEEHPTLKTYLKSIINMPFSLRILCLTNLFCWMSHVCYSIYFTDFVAESVFGGDPKAPDGSLSKKLYDDGLRYGCWGLAIYSISCSLYSAFIEKLIAKYKAKTVYVSGLTFYGVGMLVMFFLKDKISVLVFSGTAGVMYATLFTMPYIMVTYYHEKNMFGVDNDKKQIRGLGTDMAVVHSMIFMAQFMLSLCMGQIVQLIGSTSAIVLVSSVLSFFGAVAATQIMYLDM